MNEPTAVGTPHDADNAIIDEEIKDQYEVRKLRPAVNVKKVLSNETSVDTLSAQAYSQSTQSSN